jgi:hypothetical protein
MSKRLDRVLGFCTQHQYASPMLAKLGQECLKTVRTAGIFAVWRRVPITTVTITLIIGFWLYDYVSVSSAATAPAPRSSIAVESAHPLALQRLAESQPTNTGNETRKKTHRTHHKKVAHSAFRRKRVGQDEVDYVANDVTIRLFTPGPTPTRVAHPPKQRHIGKDVTVRDFEPEPATASKTRPGSAMAQAAERPALVSK